MKTLEQIRTEVKNYLTQSQKHLFKIGNEEHRIIVSDNNIIRITGKNVQIYDIDKIINCNEGSSKSALKYILFKNPSYNKKIETIRLYKDASKRYLEIKVIIKGKQDAQEIKNDILKLV